MISEPVIAGTMIHTIMDIVGRIGQTCTGLESCTIIIIHSIHHSIWYKLRAPWN